MVIRLHRERIFLEFRAFPQAWEEGFLIEASVNLFNPLAVRGSGAASRPLWSDRQPGTRFHSELDF